jgi:hypothetical protein
MFAQLMYQQVYENDGMVSVSVLISTELSKTPQVENVFLQNKY